MYFLLVYASSILQSETKKYPAHGVFFCFYNRGSIKKSFRRIAVQLFEMLARSTATRARGRLLIDEFHVPAHIALPTLFMTYYMLLGNIQVPRRLKIKFFELLTRQTAIGAFRRRHRAVVHMSAVLTFPSCKSFHTILKYNVTMIDWIQYIHIVSEAQSPGSSTDMFYG